MRPQTEALCTEMFDTSWECFKSWCDLFEKRHPDPDKVIASQEPVRLVAARLREWCLADPRLADAERREWMRRQVEGEISTAAAMKAQRAAADKDAIRQKWNSARWRIMVARESLATGLGWPYRGERVVVTTWQDARGETHTGHAEGIYLGEPDAFGISHAVWVPSLDQDHCRRCDLAKVHVRWEPPGYEDSQLERPDPAGDIALRVQGEAPDRRLPVLLPRWPEPADLTDADAENPVEDLVAEAALYLARRGAIDPDIGEWPDDVIAELTELATAGPCLDPMCPPDLNGSALADHWEAHKQREYQQSLPVWTCDCGARYKLVSGARGTADVHTINDDGTLKDVVGTMRNPKRAAKSTTPDLVCPRCKAGFAGTITRRENPQQSLF